MLLFCSKAEIEIWTGNRWYQQNAGICMNLSLCSPWLRSGSNQAFVKLRNLMELKVSSLTAGGWTGWALKVPSNPNNSMINHSVCSICGSSLTHREDRTQLRPPEVKMKCQEWWWALEGSRKTIQGRGTSASQSCRGSWCRAKGWAWQGL